MTKPLVLCEEPTCISECTEITAECVIINDITLLDFYNQFFINYNNIITTLEELQEEIDECCTPCVSPDPIFECNLVNNKIIVSGTFPEETNISEIVMTVNNVVVTSTLTETTLTYTHAEIGVANIQITVPNVCVTDDPVIARGVLFTYNCSLEIIEDCDVTSQITWLDGSGDVVTDPDGAIREFRIDTDCIETPTYSWQTYFGGQWSEIGTGVTQNSGIGSVVIRAIVTCGNCTDIVYDCIGLENSDSPILSSILNNGVVTYTVNSLHLPPDTIIYIKDNLGNYVINDTFIIDFNTISRTSKQIRLETICGVVDFDVCFSANPVPTNNSDIIISSGPCSDLNQITLCVENPTVTYNCASKTLTFGGTNFDSDTSVFIGTTSYSNGDSFDGAENTEYTAIFSKPSCPDVEVQFVVDCIEEQWMTTSFAPGNYVTNCQGSLSFPGGSTNIVIQFTNGPNLAFTANLSDNFFRLDWLGVIYIFEVYNTSPVPNTSGNISFNYFMKSETGADIVHPTIYTQTSTGISENLPGC